MAWLAFVYAWLRANKTRAQTQTLWCVAQNNKEEKEEKIKKGKQTIVGLVLHGPVRAARQISPAKIQHAPLNACRVTRNLLVEY